MRADQKAMADAILSVLRPRIIDLQKRVEELQKSALSYEGIAKAGQVYSKGMFVTHEGSLWHCNYKTISQPGHGAAWTLAMQGKDAR